MLVEVLSNSRRNYCISDFLKAVGCTSTESNVISCLALLDDQIVSE